MKKFISYMLCAAVAASSLASCDDVLNIDPTDRISNTSVWGNAQALEQYVYGFYAVTKDRNDVYTAAYFTDAFSDIIKNGSWDQYNHFFNKAV